MMLSIVDRVSNIKKKKRRSWLVGQPIPNQLRRFFVILNM